LPKLILALVEFLSIIMPMVSQQLTTSRDSANDPRDNTEKIKNNTPRKS